MAETKGVGRDVWILKPAAPISAKRHRLSNHRLWRAA